MSPDRLAKIVDQMNALHPDIIVGAGDFVGDNWVGRKYSADEAVAPLGRLRARLGVYAVLGNNDYDPPQTEFRIALKRAGVRLLEDQATSVGPIALGGLDGFIYHRREPWERARLKTTEAMARTPGVKSSLRIARIRLYPQRRSCAWCCPVTRIAGRSCFPWLGCSRPGWTMARSSFVA